MPDIQLALLTDRFMRRLHGALHAKAPVFDTERIGPGGSMVLLTLADMGCAELHELTKRVARDKSQMSRLIRGLEQKGTVSRRQSPSDARVSLIALTPKGQDVVAGLRQVIAETLDEVLHPVSEDEKATLRAILERAVG